VLQDVN